jgi:hypothetical protein
MIHHYILIFGIIQLQKEPAYLRVLFSLLDTIMPSPGLLEIL